ncbi:MAG: glucosyl-3-phosphoglycerate synthase [Actinomycetota bacterium]|jgi:glucosyl-3-phosphoglycerate synthase|nr:glucosyl-3-phosphoglycerate synthase [Actinomycetota bacterium]
MTPAALSTLRRFCHHEFSAEALTSAKKAATVSVCLPARDEAATIGPIVAAIRADLAEKTPLVDEIVVIDDRSTDTTAAAAAASGARVLPVATPSGSQPGKGAAMATALAESRGEIVVFLDADVERFSSHFVVGLLGPLLADRSIGFVKATYQRPLAGVHGGGGRVTELAAKPLLALLHPELGCFAQPLAGEIAARRSVIGDLALPGDYGVDVALLIDVSRRIGIGAMAEVDLGQRHHRNRPLADLAPQARSVARVILSRAGVDMRAAAAANTADPATIDQRTRADRRGVSRAGEDQREFA